MQRAEQVKIKNCKIKRNVYVLGQIMNIKSVNVSHWGHKIAIFYVQNEMSSYMYTKFVVKRARMIVGGL